MPSTTEKQAHFMSAIAHGWHPTGLKGPSVEVAKEFHEADKRVGKYEHFRSHDNAHPRIYYGHDQ